MKFPAGNNALDQCAYDAEDMRAVLLGAGYPPDNVITVLDRSHVAFLDKLSVLTRRLDGAEDCHVVLFYSGFAMDGAGGETVIFPAGTDVLRTYYVDRWLQEDWLRCELLAQRDSRDAVTEPLFGCVLCAVSFRRRAANWCPSH